MEPKDLKARALLREGVSSLRRPPFVVILLVSLFASYVSGTFALQDQAAVVPSVLLWVVLAYMQITTILAAAAGAPAEAPPALLPDGGGPGSADVWLREALKRRCFLRFFVADLFSLLLVAVAMVALIVPGLIVGGIVTLAPIAAVLGFDRPADAVRRSIELTKPARRAVAIVFGATILVPAIALQASFYLGDGDVREVGVAVRLVVVVLDLIGVIALTRAYVYLGGKILPRSARPMIGAPPT